MLIASKIMKELTTAHECHINDLQSVDLTAKSLRFLNKILKKFEFEQEEDFEDETTTYIFEDKSKIIVNGVSKEINLDDLL